MRDFQIQLNSLSETQRFAQALAAAVELPMLVALSGTLGAGKTQLVRYVAQSLGVAAEEVTSPTYVLLQRYAGRHLIYHFDFYRLKSAAEVWDLGIDELLEQSALIFVEWAEKFPECLPIDRFHIQLEPVESAVEQCRLANITSVRMLAASATGPRSETMLSRVCESLRS
jgi:tRNA threonylcarbamoyladenosine biosynthesis protein TsaE